MIAKAQGLEADVKRRGDQIAFLQRDLEKAYQDYDLEDQSEYIQDPASVMCGQCGQALPDGQAKIEEARAGFNRAKASKLELIAASGKRIKANMEQAEADMAAVHAALKELQEEIAASKAPEAPNTEELAARKDKAVQDDIVLKGLHAELQAATDAAETFPDATTEEVTGLEDLNLRRVEIGQRIFKQEQRVKSLARVDELKAQSRVLGSELAALEREDFIADQITGKYATDIESAVNGLFRTVTFRMFRQQVNGGMEACCDPLINGVPYPDANNAAKINAGLDIISVLALKNDAFMPIFIDNSEAVNEVIAMPTQVILLRVTTDKTLTIKTL
jgi:chromosome segregation ATPase